MSASHEKHRVLVVEDDPDISESIKDVLESEGYQVFTASNGREGLERLDEIGLPCVILLDLMMPVMSGGEFVTALRHRSDGRQVPVVIVSAWREEAARLAAVTQGYLAKPVSLEALLSATEAACADEALPAHS